MRKRAADDGHEGADRELPARREAKPARGARGRARQRDGQTSFNTAVAETVSPMAEGLI